MKYMIEIEVLIANALIESVERTGKRTIPFNKLRAYEKAVVENLREKDIDVMFTFKRDFMEHITNNCSKYFSIRETTSDAEVRMRRTVSTKTLRKHFRTSIPLDALSAFTSEAAIKAITA